MSRGLAVSRAMRLSRRSMSRMPSSERRSSSRCIRLASAAHTASRRWLISAASIAGAQHPGAQQALAHRRQGVVEGAEERHRIAGAGKQRLDQLQVAHGDGVENEAVLALVIADAVHVVERSALGLANLGLPHIVEDGSGGAGGGVVRGQSEALQREHAEVIFHQRNGVVGGEDPVVERSLAPARKGRQLGGGQPRRGRPCGWPIFACSWQMWGGRLLGTRLGRSCEAALPRGRLKQRQRGGVEQLARTQGLQLVGHAAVGVRAAEFGGAEVAGREIERGKAEGGGDG